jgi:ribonuclease Y
MMYLLYLGAALAALVGGMLFVYARRKLALASVMLRDAQDQLKLTKRDVETERREAQLRIKDEIYRKRSEFEIDIKRERSELDKQQRRLTEKFEAFEEREQRLDETRREIQQRERTISRTEDYIRANEAKIKNMYDELLSKLERIGSMTRDEARQALLETLQNEVNLANQKWIQKVEEETRCIAKDRSVDLVVTAMQRYTAEQVAPSSSSAIHLPNDDMKGRIIGKEGRNIKALEMATGVEFIIGETPEVITISGFNPIRREVAKRSLERLIADGRINPTRIEEMVTQCEKEVDEMIEEHGRAAVLELNLQGVHSDIVTLLGKLHFRTSYSQNVLVHSKEVAIIARMLAGELGLDSNIAARAGLFHDIGKAVTAEVDGPHASIGGDIAKRCGESALIVNAISAHHDEVEFASVYAPLMIIADTISASRPGARRETLTAYIKRLEKLEEIAHGFEGVKKAYALQAGRELRIIVEEDRLDDEAAKTLARDLAHKIEQEMNFPGQIKVNVIREKRAIEYAK